MIFRQFGRARWTRACAGLAVVLALAACGREKAGAEPDVLAVEAVTVHNGDGVVEGESYPAMVRNDREARLAFRAGGIVRTISVRPGDRLAAGAVVAIVDNTAQQAAVTRAEAEVARLERTAGRLGRLAIAGAVGDAQARDSGDALIEARAALAAARHELDDTRIRMPFAGTVLRRNVEVGEVAGPGMPVATVIQDSAPLVVVADIPAERVARLRPGARGWLRLSGRAEPVPAVLRRMPGGGDATSGFARVEFIPARTARLVSGETGSLTFEQVAPTSSDESVLPVEALLWVRGDRAAVYLVDGQSRARRREVRFLGLGGSKARISGLGAGTRVITTGAGFAREGQRVEVAMP